MTYGSLFAGIGGFDLGLERAGMVCKWQVENDEYCKQVLKEHRVKWPDAASYDDVRDFPPEPIQQHRVDLICGGFPCQDLSLAGRGGGLDGRRSGLWWEMHRIIHTLRPRYVIIENVPDLARTGLSRVLRALAESGYDAEWHSLQTNQFGLAHERARLFVVAYTAGIGWSTGAGNGESRRSGVEGMGKDERRFAPPDPQGDKWDVQRWVSEVYTACNFPPANPTTKREVDGIPQRLDRVRVCGNSVSPHIVEWIGRKIIKLQTDLDNQPGR